jgi:hypothetical protein
METGNFRHIIKCMIEKAATPKGRAEQGGEGEKSSASVYFPTQNTISESFDMRTKHARTEEKNRKRSNQKPATHAL